MRKIWKYLLWSVGGVILLPLLAVFLLYLPGVQRLVAGKVADYLAGQYGMVVQVGEFRLGYPLQLKLKEVYVGNTATDTLAAVGGLRLEVGIEDLFQQQLSVRELVLDRVTFGMSDTTGMLLKVRTDTLTLKADKIDLKNRRAEIDGIRLAGGEVRMETGKSTEADTSQSEPTDWQILIDRLELERISYRMSTESLPLLDAGVAAGKAVGCDLALGTQTVDLDTLALSGAWCRMVTAGGDTLNAPPAETVPADTAGMPWTVRVKCAEMDNSLFSMSEEGAPKALIALHGIGVRVEQVFNRGTLVRARLKDVWASQQDGITLTSLQGEVRLDSLLTSLQGGYLCTPNSRIRIEAGADTHYQNLPGRKPLSLLVSGSVGMGDLLPFYPELPEALCDRKIKVNTSLSLTDDRFRLGQLILEMPGSFKITGSGSLQGFRDLSRMKGSLILRGELPDLSFVRHFVPDLGVEIPQGMDLLAKVDAKGENLQGTLRLCCPEGCLSVDGGYHTGREMYDGEAVFSHFPLYRFLPADSLGSVTANIRLTGEAFDWSRAKAEVYARIRSFGYQGHDYENIALGVSLDRTRLRGSVMSRDKAAPLGLVFKGDSLGERYQVALSGKVGVVDLYRLHLMEKPFAIGTGIRLETSLGQPEKYALKVQLDSLKLSDANKRYNLGKLGVKMSSEQEAASLEMESGDLRLKFEAEASLPGFVESLGEAMQEVQAQIEQRNVNMERISKNLPFFTLDIAGADKNAISRFLQLQGMGFKHLNIGMVSRKRSGLRLGVAVKQPYVGNVELDSLQAGVWQTGKSLMYSLLTNSSSETWKGLFNIGVTGRAQGEYFRIELKQKDEQERVGFELGVNTVLGDSVLSVSFFPVNPILAYCQWMVNEDNRVDIGEYGRLRANLRMAYRNKLVSILSLPDEGERVDRIKMEIAGIDLSSLSTMLPLMPMMSGELNTDLLVYTFRKQMGVDGTMAVKDLGYEGKRIGTLDLDADYLLGKQFTDHTVRLKLTVDRLYQALVEGGFNTSEEHSSLNLNVKIPSLPLPMVNAFLPADLMSLEGTVTGDMRLRGTMEKPLLNGGLAFRDGKVDVVMLGTAFRLDTSRIALKNGRLRFNKYRFIAPNNSDLTLNGTVTLTPFDRMRMDLALDARNFEAVNVKKNETSLIYGKAYAGIHAKLAGPLSGLNMTGGIHLLNSTDITYTLRSSDPTLEDKSVDLVRFETFRDSVEVEEELAPVKLDASSFGMKMQIEIGDQVRAGVDLSEDGTNHANIQGGGNLVLVTNPESGMTLSGKYILTGGTVEYNVPIVGKKEFNIRNGSFIEWTGNLMNPLLNISAAEQVKADVEEGDQSRQVVFESIIRIANTLSHPDIQFDLAAPNDMVIQNQLATFSPEERTRQALNLLIYNSYTAPGTTMANNNNTNMANNAIYSFVENELNKYTRKAGLTVGFDSHGTEESMMRTDVTYQFSRQLFNDRIRVKIGGRISTDGSEGEGSSLQDNLVDDISIEYVLTKKRNLYAKVFRHSNYESVLDGEVIQTGAGVVWRKTFRKFKDLFKNKNREERRAEKRRLEEEMRKQEEGPSPEEEAAEEDLPAEEELPEEDPAEENLPEADVNEE